MQSFNNQPTNIEWLFENTAKDSVEYIKQADLVETDVDCSSLKNFKTIGSYNWPLQSTQEKPIVLVPGRASHLVTNQVNQQLYKSQYEQMWDENRYFMNEYPIEPIFRVVKECSPSFDFSTVDIVSDRNNLRKLLDFVEGNRKESFRIDFQHIGNILVLIRNEENTTQFCDDYGKDFEKKFSEDTGNFGAYRQIVTYKLGDFQIVTRFEVDCIEETSQLDDKDELVASKVAVNLDLEKPKQFEKSSKLHYIENSSLKGDCRPKLIEMTTKSANRGNYEFPTSKWNQMFFSNTDYLLIGWHTRGMLEKVEKLNLDQVSEKCGRNQTSIKSSTSKLNDLLHRLKSIAMKE